MSKISVVALCLLAVAGCATSSGQAGKGQKPDEHAAASAMRTIATSEVAFQVSGVKTNAADKVGEFGTLAELVKPSKGPGFITPKLASGMAHGYMFVVTPSAAKFCCTATPVAKDKSRLHFYFVDETGVIREEVGRPAGPKSPPLQ